MIDVIEHLRQIIDQHSQEGHDDSGAKCSCGATGLSDHPHHVAEEIVNRLRLVPEYVGDVKQELRYKSALCDDELTKLEGAE